MSRRARDRLLRDVGQIASEWKIGVGIGGSAPRLKPFRLMMRIGFAFRAVPFVVYKVYSGVYNFLNVL